MHKEYKKPPKRKGYNRARGTGNAKNKEAPTNSPLKHQETRNKQNTKQSYLNGSFYSERRE
jgi:hypothetical protein